MEKNLYIPTSSLNFNSIVSSESISPHSYYAMRSYGIKRYVNIFDGQLNNCIILSDQLLGFSRPLSDVEDHPMVIEVSVDKNDLQPIGDGFYATNETIYITPYTSRFIFFSEQDRLVTESLSEHSLDVKLSDLYIHRMLVVQPTGGYDFSKINLDAPPTLNIAEDERNNRLKGMLYGYYVGSMLSTNKIEIEKLKILQEVQNEFSAIISSGNKYPSSAKENVLRELSTRWSRLSPLYIELANAQFDVHQLSSILLKHGVRLPINHLGIKTYIPYLTSSTSEGETNPAMNWIESEIENQHSAIRKSGNRLSPEDGEIVIDGSNVVNINVQDHSELVRCWLNTVLLDYTRTPLGEYSKMELADMITDSAIEFFGDKWKDSSERVFLNKLRKHIAGEAFDVEWNNGTLSSVAAVVLRGDEWDTLLNFMQRKGMYDYRLAFALFGALTGYANMTRDFVDMLYDDRVYGQSIYKEFYGQLFGKDLQINAENIHDEMSTATKPILEVSTDPTKSNPIIEAIVQKIIKSEKYDNKKHRKYIVRIQAEQIDDWNRILSLSGANRDGWKGLIKDIQKGFEGKGTPIKRGKEKTCQIKTPTLFNDEIEYSSRYSKSIIYDKVAFEHILECPTLPHSIRSSVKEMFIEFQKSYQSGYYSKHSEQYKRNNSDVIDHFNKWTLSRMNKNALPWTDDNRSAMDSLKKYLLQFYPD